MANKLETIQILFVKRNARKRGRTSSDDYNDMIDELAHDLARFNTQWNNSLVPLTSAIPDGTVDSSIDAFTNGLSGRHLYADATSTSTYNPTYYNAASGRPYSILEQFTQVYGTIQSTRNDLSAEIQASIPTAENIIISDAGGYYSASNVEDALAEIKTSVNNIELGNLDLSAVAQHYVPLNDNTWDIGNSLKRVRDLYLGPSSLNIIALSAESEAPSDKTYSFRVNSSDGVLELYETGGAGTVIARFGTTGTTFPAGGGGNIPLNDLTDVVVPSPNSLDFLRYDGANWVNDTIEINDLTNVSTSSPSVAEFLRFDGSNWVNDTATISGLADVLAINPNSSDFLRFNGSSWDNDTAELNDLTDVAIPSPVNLHVLMHNGVNWGSKQLAINEISGIAITPGSLTDHAFLVYDGTYWRNKTALGSVLLDAGVAGPTSVSAGQGIVSVLNNSALGRTVLTFKDDQGTTHQLADDITQNFTVTNFLSVGSNNSPTTSGYELEVKSSEDAKIFVEGNRDNTGDGDASIIFARDGNYGSLGVFENGQVYGEELGGILDHIDNAIILHAGNASDNASIQLANNGYSRISLTASGQVGIHENDPAPLAALDVRGWWTDTPGGTSYYGGLLVPRLTGGIRLSNLASAPDGSVIYTTDENKFWGMVNGVWTDLGNQGVEVTGTPTPGDLTYFDSSNSITNKNGFSFSGDLLSLRQITVASGLFYTMDAIDGIKLGSATRAIDGVIHYSGGNLRFVHPTYGNSTIPTDYDIIKASDGAGSSNYLAVWQNNKNLKQGTGLYVSDNGTRLFAPDIVSTSGIFSDVTSNDCKLNPGASAREETGTLRYFGELQVYDGGWNDVNQGDVKKVGTPVNTRVAFWSGDGTLDHHEDFVLTEPVAGKQQLRVGAPGTVGISDTAATLIVGDHTNGPQLVLVTPFGDSFTQPFEMYHKTSFGTRDEIIWTTDEGSTRTKYASIMMDTYNPTSGSRLVLRNASDNAGTMNNGLVLFENGNATIGYNYTSPIGNFSERLSINGGIELGAALGTTHGTIQYNNGTIEARIAGSWVDLAAVTTPAGSNSEIQFNINNSFSSSSKLKWNDNFGRLTVSGVLQLHKQSDPPNNDSNYGYLWVKDDNPSTLWFTNSFGGDFQLGNSSPPVGNTQDLQYNDGGVFAATSGIKYIDGSEQTLLLEENVRLLFEERSTPPNCSIGYGSIWVRETAITSTPWFTSSDSANLPFMLADSVGTDNQIPVWTSFNKLESDDDFTFSYGTLQASGLNAALHLQSSHASCLISATGNVVLFNVLTDDPLQFVTNNDYTAANQASMYQGKLFLGSNAVPTERLEVNGAIKIGDAESTDNGTVRWTGTDFEGRKGGSWVSLTDTAPGIDGVFLFNDNYQIGAVSGLRYIESDNRIDLRSTSLTFDRLDDTSFPADGRIYLYAKAGSHSLFFRSGTGTEYNLSEHPDIPSVLTDLDDVSGPSYNDQILVYNTLSGQWLPRFFDDFTDAVNIDDSAGTPVNSQIARWTGSASIEGTNDLVFVDTQGYLSINGIMNSSTQEHVSLVIGSQYGSNTDDGSGTSLEFRCKANDVDDKPLARIKGIWNDTAPPYGDLVFATQYNTTMVDRMRLLYDGVLYLNKTTPETSAGDSDWCRLWFDANGWLKFSQYNGVNTRDVSFVVGNTGEIPYKHATSPINTTNQYCKFDETNERLISKGIQNFVTDSLTFSIDTEDALKINDVLNTRDAIFDARVEIKPSFSPVGNAALDVKGVTTTSGLIINDSNAVLGVGYNNAAAVPASACAAFSSTTKGIKLPHVTTTTISGMTPTVGLTAFDYSLDRLNIYTGISWKQVAWTTDIEISEGVQKTGTPVANQVPIWTDATTIKGSTEFVFDTALAEIELSCEVGGYLKLGSSASNDMLPVITAKPSTATNNPALYLNAITQSDSGSEPALAVNASNNNNSLSTRPLFGVCNDSGTYDLLVQADGALTVQSNNTAATALTIKPKSIADSSIEIGTTNTGGTYWYPQIYATECTPDASQTGALRIVGNATYQGSWAKAAIVLRAEYNGNAAITSRPLLDIDNYTSTYFRFTSNKKLQIMEYGADSSRYGHLFFFEDDDSGGLYARSTYYSNSARVTSKTSVAAFTYLQTVTEDWNAIIGGLYCCDPSAGGFVITLPTSTDCKAGTLIIKNTTSSQNVITVSGINGELIDGSLYTTISEPYRSLTLVSYGNGWGII